MSGETKVMLPYRFHLPGYFLRKPHVILVADGHEIPRRPLCCRLKVEIKAQVSLVSRKQDIRIYLCIFLTNANRAIRGPIVLDDNLLDRISLGKYRIQLLSDVLFTIICTHNYRNRLFHIHLLS